MTNREPVYVYKLLLNIFKIFIIILFLRFFVLNLLLILLLIIIYNKISPTLNKLKVGYFFIYVLCFILISLTGILIPVYGCLILNAVLMLGLYLIRYLDSVNN